MCSIPVPFQTHSSGKGTDMGIRIALPLHSSGSRRKCVVSTTTHSLHPQERDLVYIAKFLAKSGKFFHSTRCYMQNILQCIQDHNREWRIKYKNELYTLYKESDIVTYIKIN